MGGNEKKKTIVIVENCGGLNKGLAGATTIGCNKRPTKSPELVYIGGLLATGTIVRGGLLFS